MKVAITGATGFVGTALTTMLGDVYEFHCISSKEIYDESVVQQALDGADACIHLASMSAIKDCELNSLEAFRTNVALTSYLADIFYRQNPNGHFIFTSTGHVYDARERPPYNELSPLNPVTVYARTKLVAESALSTLALQFKGSLTILRLFNHTHHTQSGSFALPSMSRQIRDADAKLVTIKTGNIDVERDFSSVQDLAAVFNCVLRAMAPKGIATYNIGSGTPKNIRELILLFGEHYGKQVEIKVSDDLVRANDPKSLYCDSTKFRDTFGWQSQSCDSRAFVKLFFEDIGAVSATSCEK